MKEEVAKIAIPPQVLKKEDYLFFVECVLDGMWSNNTYLAELCGVDRNTIADWKKTDPVMKARKEASRDLIKKFKKDGDLEKRLREAGMEVEPETQRSEVRVIIEDYGTENKPTTETEGSS